MSNMKDFSLRSAKRFGLSLDHYLKLLSSGKKWCISCRAFHDISEFGKDASRRNGIGQRCKQSWRIKGPKLWDKYPHPRGMKGRKASAKTKALMSFM